MSQSIRYQVFVSSTFTDLKEERAEVLQALWELDCIPTGMEAFVATNEAQWEVIQKVIDECDYYVLIIGGRYGSITSDGISYTEKEYNYAKSLDIPVLGFVHGEPEKIPVGKTEREESARASLDTFRSRVMKDHPIRKWTSAQELGGLVSRSVSRAIKVTPRPGWIRNNGASNLELLERINALTKENSDLKRREVEPNVTVANAAQLESGSDEVILEGFAVFWKRNEAPDTSVSKLWQATASWDDIFRDLGPILQNEATEIEIKAMLARFVAWSAFVHDQNHNYRNESVTPETFAEIIVQFRALGLIQKGSRKRAVSDNKNYWGLTTKGEAYLIGLLARRKKSAQLNLLPQVDVVT